MVEVIAVFTEFRLNTRLDTINRAYTIAQIVDNMLNVTVGRDEQGNDGRARSLIGGEFLKQFLGFPNANVFFQIFKVHLL
jgi:hypothetical protein